MSWKPIALVLAVLGAGLGAIAIATQPPERSRRKEASATPIPKPTIKDNWDFYRARIDDRPASVMLNLGWRATAPLKSRPHMLWVRIPLSDADQHGMGTDTAAEEAKLVADRVVARVEDSQDAIHVARIRGQGTWQLYFYAPERIGFEAHVAAELGTEHKYTAGVLHDPSWSYYLQFLYPDAERLRWMLDRDLCHHIADSGDPLTTPRPVDHTLYFPTAKSRADFAARATEMGFAVTSRDDAEDVDEPLPFQIEVQRQDPVVPEHIHEVVMKLQRAAEEIGGTYDGWGCHILAEKDK